MVSARIGCALAGLLAVGLAVPAHAADAPSPSVYVGSSIPDGQIEAAIGAIDGLAQALLARTHVPGMAVAVVRDGRVVYAKGFGVRRLGAPETIDPDTVFQLASVSKSLAATVVAHQVGTGAVRWSDPLVRHLPWFQLSDPWVTQHVTIADLFSHRSGLPDHAGDDLEDLGYDRRQVLERLRVLPLASFRDTYAYTNFGLTAAAQAVAVAAGKPWEDLSEEVLYRPLGMQATSSRFADFERRPNRAVPHVALPDGTFAAKYQRQPDAQSPAGGVSASVSDVARWMAMVLQNGRYEGREIVAAEALLPAMRAEVISTPSRSAEARPSFYGYGMGVGITSSGRVSIDHSGAFALGAATTYRMIPALGLGIVVLTNSSPIGVPEALAADFTDRVELGRSSRDWFAAYSQVMAGLMAPVGTLAGKSAPAAPRPPAPPALLAGTYANLYFGPAEVSAVDGRLVLTLGPARRLVPLAPWDGNVFTFTPSGENAPDGSRAAVTFVQSGDTPATRMTIDILDGDGMGTFSR